MNVGVVQRRKRIENRDSHEPADAHYHSRLWSIDSTPLGPKSSDFGHLSSLPDLIVPFATGLKGS